ncbi:MAG: hypothetical protein RR773_04540, partial [Raoultibacter sp.]
LSDPHRVVTAKPVTRCPRLNRARESQARCGESDSPEKPRKPELSVLLYACEGYESFEALAGRHNVPSG